MDRVRNSQVVPYLIVGITGILAIGFSPLILTELYEEGRLPVSHIGYGLTLELLGVGLGTTLCRIVFGRRASPVRIAIALVALAGMNLASVFASDAVQVGVRFVAGLIGGVLVRLAINVIVNSDRPTRVSA